MLGTSSKQNLVWLKVLELDFIGESNLELLPQKPQKEKQVKKKEHKYHLIIYEVEILAKAVWKVEKKVH